MRKKKKTAKKPVKKTVKSVKAAARRQESGSEAAEDLKTSNVIIRIIKKTYRITASAGRFIWLPVKFSFRKPEFTLAPVSVLVFISSFLALTGWNPAFRWHYILFKKINMPFDVIYISGLNLKFPQYFFPNLIILTLMVMLMLYIAGKKNAVFKRTGKSVFWCTYWFLAAVIYTGLISLYLNEKMYVLQNVLFFAAVVLAGYWFFRRDKRPDDPAKTFRPAGKKEIKYLLLFNVFVFILYVFDWNSWKYSFIGDEYAFLNFAKGILDGGYPLKMLYETGVYGYHPIWGSIYQASVMKLAGSVFLGWKLSSAIIVPLSVVPFYLWVRMLFNKSTAALAVVSFVFALPLLAFSHIGYNNIHAVFPFVTGMFLFELALRKRSYFYTFLAAAVMGIGCYSFFAARLTIIIAALYWLFHPLRKEYGFSRLFAALGMYLSIIVFVFLNPDFMAEMTAQSVFSGSEISDPSKRPAYMLLNYIHTFFSFVHREMSSHYIAGRLADVVSAAGIIAGLVWSAVSFGKDWRARFLLSGYAVLVFFIGAIVQYKYPTNTRLLFLSPMLAVFAGIGITRIASMAVLFKRPLKKYRIFLAGAAVLIAVFAAKQFYSDMPGNFRFTPEAYVIKTLQKYSRAGNVFLLMTDATEKIHRIEELADYYGEGERLRKISRRQIEVLMEKDSLKGSVVIIGRDAGALQKQLPRYTYSENIIRDYKGRPVFYVYDLNDEKYYRGFKELWKTGETDYMPPRGPVKKEETAEKRRSVKTAVPRLRPEKEKKETIKYEKNALVLEAVVVEDFPDCRPPEKANERRIAEYEILPLKVEGDYNTPSDIAVSRGGGKMVIADGKGDAFYILKREKDDEYSVYKKIELGGKKGIFGLGAAGERQEHFYAAYDDVNDIIYLLDEGRAVIKKYTPEGRYIEEFANGGFLKGARGIYVSGDGEKIGIAAPGRNLTTVLDRKGAEIHTYKTDYGGACGQYSQPCYIALGEDGKRYVVDTGNGRVMIFDRNMKYLDSRFIGRCSTIHGPQIVVDDNRGYFAVTSQYDKKIMIFDTEKNEVMNIDLSAVSGADFASPAPLSMDGIGNIYVLDPRTKAAAKIKIK
ncbi:MAG: glycosyltransferase family 39 protein [Candidatus Goldiibacteriota bacterium]